MCARAHRLGAEPVMQLVRQRGEQLSLKRNLEPVVVRIERDKHRVTIRCKTADTDLRDHRPRIVADDDVHNTAIERQLCQRTASSGTHLPADPVGMRRQAPRSGQDVDSYNRAHQAIVSHLRTSRLPLRARSTLSRTSPRFCSSTQAAATRSVRRPARGAVRLARVRS